MTSRTTKTELLETLRNGYAVRNMTPTTDATVAPGYSIYLIWLADAAADDKSLPQGKPVAEATFTNETLNLFMRFWLDSMRFWLDSETLKSPGFASSLAQAIASLTFGRPQTCTVKLIDSVGAPTKKETAISCGKKTLPFPKLILRKRFQPGLKDGNTGST